MKCLNQILTYLANCYCVTGTEVAGSRGQLTPNQWTINRNVIMTCRCMQCNILLKDARRHVFIYYYAIAAYTYTHRVKCTWQINIITKIFFFKSQQKTVTYSQRSCYDGFICQQDSAPANTARITQDWLKSKCRNFIAKDERPQFTRSQFTRLSSRGTMLESYHKLQPNPKCNATKSGLPFRRTQLIMLWKTSPSDCRLVYRPKVDILNK